MKLDAIYHRSAYTDCYPIDENEIRVNLRTGKDITKVNIIHEDPYCNGVSGRIPWKGQRDSMEMKCELKYHNVWTCVLRPKYNREQYYFEILSGEEIVYMLEDDFYQECGMNKLGNMYQYFKIPWLNASDVIKAPRWVSDTVWYQIFPDRFCNSEIQKKRNIRPWANEENMTYFDFYGGDIRGIISKLDYLKELGITGIYLTPIFESNSNHKYDVIDYERIDCDFGTESDMKQLIWEAHNRGIKIMIDAVFNHCGAGFDKWLDVVKHGKNSVYYDWFFVNKMPINTSDQKTRDGSFYSFAFEANMPKLNTNNVKVMDYLIDLCKHWVQNWKIDGIRFDVGNEISHSFIKKLRLELTAMNPDLFLLGEIWHDSIQWLQGDEYHSVMNYPFVESIHDFWNDSSLRARDLMLSINRVFSMYQEQVTKNLFNFLDSHDTSRACSRCGSLNNFFQQLTLLCTMQGTICLYYGTEIAMEGIHNPFNRRCMPWKEIEDGNYDTVIGEVKKLIEIRNNISACKSKGVNWIFHEDQTRLIHYQKGLEKENIIEVYMNAGNEEIEIHLEYEVLFQRRYEGNYLQPGGIIITKIGGSKNGKNESK